ncbi:hypothetical protein CLU95_4753 [Variovorax sp. 54]|nr:hypothetical protein CLU95_4753 [Variovorax sp. 54]
MNIRIATMARRLMATVAVAAAAQVMAQSTLSPLSDGLRAPAGGFGMSVAPPPMPKPPPLVRTNYSDLDGALLWDEAIATFNGLAYDYNEYVFDTKIEADDCADNFNARCRRTSFRPIQHRAERSNELPVRLREVILRTSRHDFSRPMPDLTTGKWTVIRIIDAKPSTFAGEVNPKEWVALHAALSLPSAQALRNDPELKMRRVMNRIKNANELRDALATQQMDKAHIDAYLSNGSTLVLKAIHLKNLELLDALRSEGASVDKCGVDSCPLTQTIYLNDRAGMRWLLSNGANPEGSGDNVTPLMAASSVADREAAELLLQAGASPLATHAEKVGSFELKRSVAFYAPSSDPSYLDWLLDITQTALEKTGKYEWSAWIEQGGTRRPVTDGASIALKRQPFKIVLRIPDDVSFRMAASEDESLTEKTRSSVFRRNLLGPGKVGASGPDGSFLSIGAMTLREGEWNFDGSTHDLSFTTDPKMNVGVKRVQAGGKGQLDVYDVKELIGEKTRSAITKFDGNSLTVVAGIVPPLGTAADFYKAARFTLTFR